MPKLNARGDVCHGIGGGLSSINNVAFGHGGIIGWLNNDEVVFANGDDNWLVSVYNMITKQKRRLGPESQASWGGAGNGIAAWQLASRDETRGVYSTIGFRNVDAGYVTVGYNGSICYRPVYNFLGPTVVREPSGQEWQLTPEHAEWAHLIGERTGIHLRASRVFSHNLPVCQVPSEGGMWRAEMAMSGGEPWVCYYHSIHGIVLHPFRELVGYSVLPKGDGWHTVRELSPQIIRVAISTHEGEQPGHIWVRDYDTEHNMVRDPWGGDSAWRPVARINILSINPPATPPEPRSEPIYVSDQVYDPAAYLVAQPQWRSKSGPSHRMDQVGPDAEGRFYYVKFDAPQHYEFMAVDANWLVQLEDASGGDYINYYAENSRWFPRKMKIGELHCYDSGVHERVFKLRDGTCREHHREWVGRRMWIYAAYDRYYWSRDLGVLPTLALVYDPTGGIHTPDRGIELGYAALGAGWVRWEYHRSDIVFQSGKAVFTDASRLARSDFYLIDDKQITPRPSGCVSQTVPHFPPWEGNVPPERPRITISSYEPKTGDAPLTVIAVATLTGGPPDRIIWLRKRKGAADWSTEATGKNTTHTYRFDAGTWAIGVRVEGPGGSDQTGLERLVEVKPEPPKPPQGKKTTFQTHDGVHYWKVTSNKVVTCNATEETATEFDVYPLGGNEYAFGFNGLYMAAEEGGGREITVDRVFEAPEQVGPWERFRVHKTPEGHAVQAHDGHFLCAEGGGGSILVANRNAIGPWETFTTQINGGGGGGGGQRQGVVRPAGRAVTDDGGEFYPLGLTFMWSMQGIKHEWDHYKANVEWAAQKGFDFLRPLTEVAWEGNRRIDPTQPEWSDWHEVLKRALDFSYDLGLRLGVTLRGKGTSVDHLWLAREAGKIIADGRTHKTLCVEMENEFWNGGDPLEELVAMARELKALVPNMLGLSDSGSQYEEVKEAAKQATLHVFIRHTERQNGDFGWRQVRQDWDFQHDRPLVGMDWEGPGPGSSVAVLTNPLQLAMKRAIGIICGAPIFVLHTGTGVFGDGKPGSTGPRPPNFWEIDNIDAIVNALRGLDELLPQGMPNWQVANTQWTPPNPVAPFQPHSHWEGDHGDGVNKAYSALAPDGRVIQLPCGVRGHVKLTASYSLHDVTVYDPLTRQPLSGFTNRSFNKGESMDLPGGGQDAMVAYIIHGKR